MTHELDLLQHMVNLHDDDIRRLLARVEALETKNQEKETNNGNQHRNA